MAQGRILAIDDEKNIRQLIQNEFTDEGFHVATAENGEEGLAKIGKSHFDVVLLDVRMPRMDGIETLRRLKKTAPAAYVIMITGYGSIETAVASMKLGAADYITKPFKLNELMAMVKQAVRRSRAAAENINGAGAAETAREFIRCPSPAMTKLYNLADRIADRDDTVLIQGETGAGKDVMACYIHGVSARKDAPLITVDCGLLSSNLAESELYGHKKGAFSGAHDNKIGLVEKSDKGTLFLDEIGNIDLDLQKKFLRFLETRRFRRIGETKEIWVDTRIILATNLDLQDAAKKGIIRQDLLYRMDVISIMAPPLRERPEDIIPLAEYFLKTDCGPDEPKTLSAEAVNVLTEYQWPGNIRELKSAVNKAAIFSDADVIMPDDLPGHIRVNRKAALPKRAKRLEDVEKEHIISILEETGGNQSQAADILGINRKTLYKKIHKHKIFS